MSDQLKPIRTMWSRGSYAVVGDWFAKASQACLDGVKLHDGDLQGFTLLDIACGTGAVAIEAARRGADVVGVDLTPSMLTEAQQRAEEAGVDVDLREGSFTDLSDFRGFDLATSAFGVMFAGDQAAVAAEVLQTLRPGGLASLAAWLPDHGFGGLPPRIAELLPWVTNGPDRGRWATTSGLEAILSEVRDLDPKLDVTLEDVVDAEVGLDHTSVEDLVTDMRRWSGPWMMLFDALEELDATSEGHAALVKRLSRFAEPRPDGGIRLGVGYAVARIRRRR